MTVLRTVLPPVLAVLLFACGAFLFVIPTLEKNLMDGKREMLRELTSTVITLLELYDTQVQSGELTLEEAQSRAKRRIREMRYGPEGKDYFWITDMHPRMVMHPFRPDLDGQDISAYADPKGKKLFTEFVCTVRKYGSGYVDYMWQWKDDPGLIVPKLSYVTGFEPWGWVVGTGIYIEDTRATIKIVTHHLSIFLIVIILLVSMLSGYMIWHSMKIDAARRAGEQRFRDLAEMLPEAIFEADRELTITYANQLALSQFGYSCEDLENGMNCFDMIAPEDRDRARANLELRKTAIEIHSFEYQALKKDGTTFPILLSISPIWKGDDIIGYRGVAVDIFERKQIENELMGNEAFLNELLDTIPLPVYYKNTECRYLGCNRSFENFMGLKKEMIVGKKTHDIHPKEYADVFEAKDLELFKTGELQVFESKLINAAGEVRDVLLNKAIFYDSQGKMAGLIGGVLDITERKQLEFERGRAGKLESIGVLAGGIAHDFNNILTIIIGNLGLARFLALEEGSKTLELFAEVENAAIRAKDLTQQLLTFAKGGEPCKKIVLLDKIIRESSEFALRGSNVVCSRNIADDLYACEVDEGQIAQVLNNLVINANHAMPNGGEVVITATNRVFNNQNNHGLRTGKYVEIAITDHGVGISKENLTKIFDPYFTTKKTGSGLGLATSYSIVRRHGGLISVESELGRGSTFRIFLPASSKQLTETNSGEEETTKITGKVLIMDDDEEVCSVVSKMLQTMGHKTDSARNGEEAVRKYEEALASGRRFDAVILDLTIRGGTGGRETIKQLKEIDHDIKAIVSSGYSNDPIVADYKKFGFSNMVSKPYRIEELGEVLQKVLCEES